MGVNHPVAPWYGDKKGFVRQARSGHVAATVTPLGLEELRGSTPGQQPLVWTDSRLLRFSQGVSMLKNKQPSLSSLSCSESSSTPGNGTTPEECPALTDSPTTLTEALQMIHPIPADSWRNLIEQIGGSRTGSYSFGPCEPDGFQGTLAAGLTGMWLLT